MDYILAMKVYIFVGLFITFWSAYALLFNKIPDQVLLAGKTKVLVLIFVAAFISLGIIIYKLGPFPPFHQHFSKTLVK